MSELTTAPKVAKSDREWRAELSFEQYRVTRGHSAERAFAGPYWNEKRDGQYSCICCGAPLSDVGAKFDSGTGWPSFHAPVEPQAVSEHDDHG